MARPSPIAGGLRPPGYALRRKSSRSGFTRSGVRMSGRCPPPGISSSRALGGRPRCSGQARRGQRRFRRGRRAWGRRPSRAGLPAVPVELELLSDDDLRRRLEANRDHLGDDVRRVRLGEEFVHEGHDESGPVSPQGLEPFGVGRRWLGLELHVRRDHGEAVEPLRIVGGQEHCRVHSSGRCDECHLLDSRGLKNGERIGCMERKVAATLRPLTGARPSWVVGDDGGVRFRGGQAFAQLLP